MKKQSSFTLENYELLFSSVFTNSSVQEAFKTFLKSEFNLEPFLFILQVDELNSIQSEKEQVQKCLYILKTFIHDDSESQINISFEKKKEILELYEKQMNSDTWTLEMKPTETFEPITKILKQELNYDPFKRFVRTNVCAELMEKFQKESDVVIPKFLKSFDYNSDSFRDAFVEDRDFEFGQSLMEDSYSWELVGSKIDQSINTFFSTNNYLPNFKEVKTLAIKSEGIFHFPIEDCVWATKTMQRLRKSDPNISYIGAYDFYNFDELKDKFGTKYEENLQKFTPRVQCTFENVMKFPPPLNRRHLICVTSYHYNKKDKIFIQVTKPLLQQDEEWIIPKKGEIKINKDGDVKVAKYYPMFVFTCIKYQEIDEGKVLYSNTSLIHSGGWANSPKLMRKIVHDRELKLNKITIDAIKQLPIDKTNIKNNYQIDPSKPEFDGMAKMVSELELKY